MTVRRPSESPPRGCRRGLGFFFLPLFNFLFLTAISFGHINPWCWFEPSYAGFIRLYNSSHEFVSAVITADSAPDYVKTVSETNSKLFHLAALTVQQ